MTILAMIGCAIIGFLAFAFFVPHRFKEIERWPYRDEDRE